MDSRSARLGQFRPYLQFLARVSWDRRLQSHLDPSDIVQQTLLRAHVAMDQFRGESDEELAGWLREILANVLLQDQRYLNRQKRSVSREIPIQELLSNSSRRLSGFAGTEPSPSQRAEFGERALRIASAVERLPEPQRDSVVLHFWQGYDVAEIAALLQRSPAAIGGLLRRGLHQLREDLAREVAPEHHAGEIRRDSGR